MYAPVAGSDATILTVELAPSLLPLTAPDAILVSVAAPLASAPLGMVPSLNSSLPLGMVASATSVIAWPIKPVTVIFLDSLALMSATARKSPATRSAPARVANSDMRRSAMAPSGYCCSHLKAAHHLPVDSSRLAPV
jgi:hypothetical protein